MTITYRIQGFGTDGVDVRREVVGGILAQKGYSGNYAGGNVRIRSASDAVVHVRSLQPPKDPDSFVVSMGNVGGIVQGNVETVLARIVKERSLNISPPIRERRGIL